MIKTYKPTQWQNRSDTAIRPELLNKLDKRTIVKYTYNPVERRYEYVLADGTKGSVDLENIIKDYDWLIVDFSEEPSIIESPKIKYTNCKNCGAPLKSDKCEYCGTYY